MKRKEKYVKYSSFEQSIETVYKSFGQSLYLYRLFLSQISEFEETVTASSDDDGDDGNSSSSLSDSEVTDVEHFSGSPIVYKNKSHFRDNEEYAKYVRDKIQAGMTVKCCRGYEEVHEGDVGKVIKVCGIIQRVGVIMTVSNTTDAQQCLTECP